MMMTSHRSDNVLEWHLFMWNFVWSCMNLSSPVNLSGLRDRRSCTTWKHFAMSVIGVCHFWNLGHVFQCGTPAVCCGKSDTIGTTGICGTSNCGTSNCTRLDRPETNIFFFKALLVPSKLRIFPIYRCVYCGQLSIRPQHIDSVNFPLHAHWLMHIMGFIATAYMPACVHSLPLK